MPDLRIPVITGVSAGAINAVHLAARRGSLAESVAELHELWSELEPQSVYRVGTAILARNIGRWALRLVSGGTRHAPQPRSLLDPAPLRHLLNRALTVVDGEVQGIDANLAAGRLEAVALTTINYGTGQTVTWVQGRDIERWDRTDRKGVPSRISVDHIMASASLPLVFPAVKLAEGWHGDGGIRLATPLAPAVHLGADRILAISTRYRKSREEAGRSAVAGYPPPAQMAGVMLNALFLDAIDLDAMHLQRVNRFLADRECRDSQGLRPVELLVLRPSVDLGRLAGEYEMRLPRTFRFLARGLGTRQTKSPDFLSLLLFQPDYLQRLIEIGEADAEERYEEIAALLAGS
jgi:NTE family protein